MGQRIKSGILGRENLPRKRRRAKMRRWIALGLVAVVLFGLAGVASARVLVRGTSSVRIGEDITVPQNMTVNDVVAIKGNANIMGGVANDVVVFMGATHLYPTAKVGGDIVSIGGSIKRDAGAEVGGDIVDISISKETMDTVVSYAPIIGLVSLAGLAMFKVFMFAGFLALAAILVAFMTRHIGVISSKIEKSWWKALFWGILGGILLCPIAMLLAITIIGIPLILVEIILASTAMILGAMAAAQIIGKKLLKAVKQKNKPMLAEVILGLLVLFLIDLIPVLGPVVKCLALTIGFGGAITAKLGYK